MAAPKERQRERRWEQMTKEVEKVCMLVFGMENKRAQRKAWNWASLWELW